MSDKVYCQLFGNPQIRLNGESIFFSFSKINALLYYLLVNKTVSRDEVAGLLWPNKDEQSAKKNLRNTIYQTNKTLKGEYITSPTKVLLVLNEELDITSDIDLFLTAPSQHLALYQGEFLKGFYLKESESFDLWIVKMRSFYEKKFVRECFQKIETDIQQKNLIDVEKNIQKLIDIDEFDERNYQLLMQFYQDNDRNGKVIETYYSLANSLKIELGINPSSQTREIYEKSLEIVNQKSLAAASRFTALFFGRAEEITQLEQNFKGFGANQQAKSVLIIGEAGVGKSALTNRVLDNIQAEFFILETQCYQAEQQHALRPWKQIVEKMSKIIQQKELIQPALWQEILAKVFPNFDEQLPVIKLLENQEMVDLNLLSQVMIEAIKKIATIKKPVFVFEDIQWLDDTSLGLLTSVMLHLQQSEALFMFTSRNEYNSGTDDFLTTLKKYNFLETIELKPFTITETKLFIRKKLPKLALTEEMVQNIYAHTEGNLFFLIEYISLLQTNTKLDTMTVKMQDALKNRFLYLSPDERNLTSIVSYFYDSAPITILSAILEKDTWKIVNLIENLVNKNILKEQMDGEQINVQFTHSKLRDYMYMNQPTSKKRVIHRKIAEELEAQIKPQANDSLHYSKIAFHYAKAKNELKSLTYEIAYLQNYLGFHHELFPVFRNEQPFVEPTFSLAQGAVIEHFNKIKNKLTALTPLYQEDETYHLLVIKILYLEGRYLIRHGEYHKGIDDIQRVISKASELNHQEYILKGYKQMVFYYIQIDDTEGMFRYVELALDMAIKTNNHELIGVLLRLKGLYYIMSGNLYLAEKLLKESISTFMITDETAQKYSINIGAAYNYLGEIRHIEGNEAEAIQMYHQAINLCVDKGSVSSLSVFYINTGISLFAQQKYQQAKQYLMKAYGLYENFSSLWKRPQLDAYLALINLYEGDDEAVFAYIASSKKYSKSMSSPRDIGTVYFAEAMIKYQLKNRLLDDHRLSELLPKEATYYYQKALDYLNPYRDTYELATLATTFKTIQS
ncbi:AAA family ATPase [Isobaculum melis]|uniref:DNA-binding transcriptional activator of the SARP family n=1 Tax=Isobaculum melis TaxID=142588 RepID=A0A1H9UC63_9LACT|nr:AAA family ATPase [Isobaculum melis]SES06841.1 DNA-binding transcriptional activator of the SARP family [Isobaculum melis]